MATEKIIHLFEKQIKKINLLDKYILKQVLEVFVLGVIIFTSIAFASDTFISLIKQISAYGIPFNIAFLMILLNLPSIIVMTIPMATLFATVMTLNRLSLNSEITVMRACSIGLNRIARPIFIFGIVVTALSFLINELIVPQTSLMSKHLAIYSLQQKHVPEGKTNFTFKELKEGTKLKRLFYIERCENKTLHNITLLDMSREDTIQLVQAKAGKTASAGWIFNDGVIYTLSTTGKIFNTTLFNSSTVNFGIDAKDAFIKDKADQYNFFKLMKYISDNKTNLKEMQNKWKIQLYDKITLPLTTMAMILIGVPLAITPPRVRYNRGFLFSILIIFLYYVLRALSISFGQTGAIPAYMAAWLPIIIISLLGAFLYWRKVYTIT